jgi:hypothetical protein
MRLVLIKYSDICTHSVNSFLLIYFKLDLATKGRPSVPYFN